jgi:ADP-ribosylglycohydrolase
MIPSASGLRKLLEAVISDKEEQGHQTASVREELEGVPDHLDELMAFAQRLSDLPMRPDWPYVEPTDLDELWMECDQQRPTGEIGTIDLNETSRRIQTAFLGRVCGCMLGKAFEIDVTMEEIRAALEPLGEWPLADYPSEQAIHALPIQQGQWLELARERIDHVAPDDDLNYTILAMLALESHGKDFSRDDLLGLWLFNLPIAATFGPERTILLKAGIETLTGQDRDLEGWTSSLNPGEELCGALIRADAYGYACPGRPALAAELAHRDATLTHNRTGVYGAMFVAAAIAAAFVSENRMDVFRTALRFVPLRSRFHEAVSHAIDAVEQASDWLDGYHRINETYGRYGFCRIYQEIGTVINSVSFAEDIGHGICLQVCQGNDTDSFGATAGSILGAFFGGGYLDPRWVEPLRDDIHTALALFHERSLSRIAQRMSELPRRLAQETAAP